MADRTLAYLRRVFTWHATRSDDFRIPMTRGMARTKPAERARDRILSDDELRAVWIAAKTMNNGLGPFVHFVLLTACPRNEAAHMRRSEVSGDVWTIPAKRNKSKKDHVVPLAKAAQAILDALPIINDSDLVFTHNGKRPIAGFTRFKARHDALSGVTGWTFHNLRRTAQSLLSRCGVNADIAERCLGHVIAGVRGVYDRHSFLEEKRAPFEALAAEIERIINPQENVI
jgi:integrase